MEELKPKKYFCNCNQIYAYQADEIDAWLSTKVILDKDRAERICSRAGEIIK